MHTYLILAPGLSRSLSIDIGGKRSKTLSHQSVTTVLTRPSHAVSLLTSAQRDGERVTLVPRINLESSHLA